MECNYDPSYGHPLAIQYNYQREVLKKSGSVDAEYIVSISSFNTEVKGDKSKYTGGWKIHRQRHDKTEPNSTYSAKSVWESIVNSVEQSTLLEAVDEIIEMQKNGGANAKKRVREESDKGEPSDDDFY